MLGMKEWFTELNETVRGGVKIYDNSVIIVEDVGKVMIEKRLSECLHNICFIGVEYEE